MFAYGDPNRSKHVFVIEKHQPGSGEDLRDLLKTHFQAVGQASTTGILMCNYAMDWAGQGVWWGGHISPVAAYDQSHGVSHLNLIFFFARIGWWGHT